MNKEIRLFELESSRLHLRRWYASDLEPFAELNSDPKVMEFFPAVLSRVESDILARRLQGLIEQRGWGVWAVEIKDSGEFIGFVGLHVTVPELPISPCVEIGWRLAAKFWGEGYATEAAREAIRFGFEQLNLSEIVSYTSLGNFRSRAVMKRLGMFDSGLCFEHPDIPVNHKLRKHCVYKIDFDQWNNHLEEINHIKFNQNSHTEQMHRK